MPFDPKRIDRIDPKHQPRNQRDTSQADGSAVAPRMPSSFEPRLIQPEPAPTNDQGDLDLPDDLTALAEQLQDDAAHLANCYSPETSHTSSALPAATATLPSTTFLGATAGLPSSAPRRFALLTATAATIALALSIAIFANREAEQDRDDRPTTPAAESNQPDYAEPDTLANNQLDHLDQSESLLLLGDASGPEREGLLDLLQQTASTETSISF